MKISLKAVVVEIGEVNILPPKTRVEITDLDCLTIVEEVENVIRGALEEGINKNQKVSSSTQPSGAVVEMDEKAAKALIKAGGIGIGWVNAMTRKPLQVTKCIKCLGFGHVRQNCK